MHKNFPMQVLGISSWTQTPGAGSEIVRKLEPPKTSQKIISFGEFKGILRKEEEMHLERLEDLKFQLEGAYTGNTDPVHFLYYLYYTEFLSLRDITKRLEDTFSMVYPVTSLRNLFDLLGWERRENFDEENPITARKNSAKAKNGVLGKKADERKEKIQGIIDELILQAVPKNFSKDEFEKKTAKYKVFYLVETLFGKSLEQYIAEHFQGLSLMSVGKILKEVFSHAISTYNLEIENPLQNERKLSDMLQGNSYSENEEKIVAKEKNPSKSIHLLHERVKSTVDSIMKEQQGKEKSFNMREYNTLKKDSAQATYILKSAGVIEESLDELIVQLMKEFEAPSVAVIINTLSKQLLLLMTIFDEEIGKLDYPEVSRQTILHRLRKMEK